MKFKTFRALVIAGSLVIVAGVIVAGSRNRGLRETVEAGGSPAAVAPVSTIVPTAAPSSPPAQEAPEGALRAMDRDILALLDRPMSGDKIKDAFPSRSYKVNVYKDAGYASANRLKIDYDRDEQDDEKWTIEVSGADRKIKRQVSPKDDGNYPDEFRLAAGAWTRKE